MAVFAIFALALVAQGPMTFQYFYDDTGQLIKVVDSTGVVIEYVYDAVGNMLEVKRSNVAPNVLTIFSFTPQGAGPLTLVTIQGQGFSGTVAANIVRFGGVAARVVSATATTLVVEVPVGAVTGPISVTVGAASASSSAPFAAQPVPVILSVSPNSAVAGATISSFQITGFNLTGTTFSFTPTFTPAAIAIGSVVINPAGTSATVSLTVGTALGEFAAVATNSFGSSDAFATSANTLKIGSTRVFETGLISILNTAEPPRIPSTTYHREGRLFSILNTTAPASAPSVREAISMLFSILNGIRPGAGQSIQQETSGLTFSMLNQAVGVILSSGLASPASREWNILAPDLALRASSYGGDTDGDGIPDTLEHLIHTNPDHPDTDGDGFPDGLEVVLNSDPLDSLSRPRISSAPHLISPVFSIKNVAVAANSARGSHVR